MDHKQVGYLWNGNAEAWTKLAHAGYDVYRDHLNTPAFFEMLPDISGISGIDIGCGEGHNTRLLARRCARVTAIDISEAHRVLKPGGFLQFSICHPCFDTPHRRNLRDEIQNYILTLPIALDVTL